MINSRVKTPENQPTVINYPCLLIRTEKDSDEGVIIFASSATSAVVVHSGKYGSYVGFQWCNGRAIHLPYWSVFEGEVSLSNKKE